MREKIDRDKFLGAEDSELRKFRQQNGCVNEVSEGIDEETARNVNALLDKARRGELKEITTEEMRQEETKIFKD